MRLCVSADRIVLSPVFNAEHHKSPAARIVRYPQAVVRPEVPCQALIDVVEAVSSRFGGSGVGIFFPGKPSAIVGNFEDNIVALAEISDTDEAALPHQPALGCSGR